MNLERESRRWVQLGIIDAEQRTKILALYEGGVSLMLLGILWAGGVLVFLGVAFLLSILWDDLGPLRSPVVLAIDGAFFTGGWLLLKRAELAKTAMALLVIGGLLLLPALGITWDELFGSSGHPLPLVALCGVIYGLIGWRLRSHAFSVLFCAALFIAAEEIVRDDMFEALFPLVQLGLVSSLEDVFPIVFLSAGGAVIGLSYLVGRTRHYAHLRPTLLVCALLIALLPALVGGLTYHYKGFKMFLALVSCVGGMGISIFLRERKAFWVSSACLGVGFLILFGEFFENSIAFTCFAIFVGLITMGVGARMAFQKNTWLDQFFQKSEEELALLHQEEEKDEQPALGGRAETTSGT